MTLLPQQVPYSQMLTKWASIINPLLKNPASNPSILKEVSLVTGNNVVNHKLGQKLQGWYITRMRDVYSQVYDTQDTNQTPALTLNLHASSDVVVDIAVF